MSHLHLLPFEFWALWTVFAISILGLAYAFFLRGQVMAKDKGDSKMQEVWNAIREGADAYLGRQLKTIVPLIAILAVVLFLSVYVAPPSAEAAERFPGATPDQLRLYIGIFLKPI